MFLKLSFVKIVIIVACSTFCKSDVDVDERRSISWGPGLRPHLVVMPARYFFVQLVDSNKNNVTVHPYEDIVAVIGPHDTGQRCRVWTQVLNRQDGSFIVRYKVYETCRGITISVQYQNKSIGGFPLVIADTVLPDDCYCPVKIDTWLKNMECPAKYRQIIEDLKPFTPSIAMDKLRAQIIAKFNKTQSMSVCHIVVKNNEMYRKCYGQHIGFNVFIDAILLSLARKLHLPDVELFVNLGDWPLERSGPNPLPMFSWCGSDDTADIVMPTYDITESTLESMGRVQLDMLSVQGNTGPVWKDKQTKLFWRGRDSRIERLHLIDIARAHPHLFNASLTNFFFFRDKQEQYGPKEPYVSFFEFFKYKYQLSIDGTVAPYRMPYLLAGDSLVFKQDSPYYEHFYKDLEPNVHYIPVKRDLTNLVDQLVWATTHDTEAYRIAQEGALYARHNLMPANIFCYYAVLLKEWSERQTSKVKVLEGMEKVEQREPSASCPCTSSSQHTEL